jgi:hypothetical protein
MFKNGQKFKRGTAGHDFCPKKIISEASFTNASITFGLPISLYCISIKRESIRLPNVCNLCSRGTTGIFYLWYSDSECFVSVEMCIDFQLRVGSDSASGRCSPIVRKRQRARRRRRTRARARASRGRGGCRRGCRACKKPLSPRP